MRYTDSKLAAQLQQMLLDAPEGLSEYAMLKRLRELRWDGYEVEIFSDSLALFRAHFRLFHTLHQLRNQLLEARRHHLEISPLMIRLIPYCEPGSSALAEPDAMRSYYLDRSHLTQTSREEVEQMLGAFWSWFHNREGRRSALDVLGLEDPVDEPTIRDRFRRLAMQHHPDRGGDSARFREIRQAMELLRNG